MRRSDGAEKPRETEPAAPASLRLEFSLHVELSPGTAPSPVRAYRGAIWHGVAEAPVGRVEAFVIDFAQPAHRPSDILSRDADLEPYLALYPNDQLGPAVQNLIGAALETSSGLFILHRLELLPDARGGGLGYQVIEGVLASLGRGCLLAALLPFPQQCNTYPEDDPWASLMEYAALSRNRRQSVTNLKRFYARAQFHPVRGTELMIRNLVR